MEQWQTEEKQQAHLLAPHMDQLRRLKSQYVADGTLTLPPFLYEEEGNQPLNQQSVCPQAHLLPFF